MASNTRKPFSIDEDESLQVPTTSSEVDDSVERAQLVREPEGIDTGYENQQAAWDRMDQEIASAQPEELEAQIQVPSPITTKELTLDQQVAPAEVATPKSKRNQILENYKALRTAQGEQNNRLSKANYLLAGNQIAQAVASGHGAKIGDGSEAVNALRKDAEVPVTQAKDNIKYGNEQEMADPNSAVSNFYRENAYGILEKLYPGKKVDLTDLSALQMSKIPGLGKALENKSAINKPVGFGMFINADTNEPLYFDQEDRKIKSSVTGQIVDSNTRISRPIGYEDPTTGNRGYLTSSGMAIPGGARPNALPEQVPQGATSRIDLTEFRKADKNAYGDFTKVKEKMLTDMKESRDTAGAMVTLASKLTPGPNGEIDSGLLGGIQTQAAKLAGQKGVLTDQDLVKFAGAGGVEAKIARIIDGSLFGDMTDDDIKFFKRFATLMGKSVNKIIENDSQIHMANALDTLKFVYPDATMDDARQLLKVDKIAPAVQGNQQVMVTLKHKSGKTQKVTKDKAKEYMDQFPNDFTVEK